VEPFPIAVTKNHFPNMKHLGDITQINGAEIEPVEIITGGSPCQDLSVAGKRAGLAGERSGLFMEQVRIIKEMREHDRATGRSAESIRPRFMVWENVPGAFSSNGGEDFRAVLEETARIADETVTIPRPRDDKWNTAGAIMGRNFSIAWRVLDAQYWGVPQRRRRIFLVADFAGHSAGEILFKCESVSGDIAESRKAREEVAANTERSVDETSDCLTPWDVQSRRIHKASGKWPALYGGEGGGHGYAAIPETKVYGIQGSMIGRADKNGPQGDGINEDVSFTLNTTDRHAVAYGICSDASNSMKSNNPHSGIYEADTSRTIDQNGGNPACNQGGMAIVQTYSFQRSDEFKETDKASTQSRRQYKDATDLIVSQRYSVRRLTPTECERLQGYPTVMEVKVSEMTKDEYIAFNLAANNITVNFETGQVYAFRGPGGFRLDKPIELKGTILPSGYKVISIRCGEVKKQCRVNRIMWIAANGVPPEGYVVDHINNDKLNNRLSNLQLLTPGENSTKAKEDGLYLTGEDNPATKISNEVARQICDDYKQGDTTMRRLAEQYGISKSRVHQIIQNNGWTAGGSDTARYKALGNSVAVPCTAWIMGQIANKLRKEG
jgi:site-specific DNA-cytosine methylase